MNPELSWCDLPLPTWQRGHRVHGYWLDGQRMGHVGLSPRGLSPVVYGWAIDASTDAWGEGLWRFFGGLQKNRDS